MKQIMALMGRFLKKLIVFSLCLGNVLANNESPPLFQEDKVAKIVEKKPSIVVGDVVVEWFSSKISMDLRQASIFQILGYHSDNIYNLLEPNRWFVGSCEIVKNNGANGLDREWKGDIPENINADIFIPASVVDGDAEYLSVLLHRIIPLAIYEVIHKEIEKERGKPHADLVKLKWANDVLVNGKKICGIKPDDFGTNDKVVSYQFGINVNMSEKDLAKIDQPATSLSVECGKHIDPDRILREIVLEIVKLMQRYKENLNDLDNDFSSKMAFLGEEVVVYDYVPGKNIEGVLEGVSGGRLYLRNPQTGQTFCILPGYGLLRSKKLMEEAKFKNRE
ncbi:MAG: hypothetical protein LBF44_00260 [Holosporaceae bacterium]|jgi:biotin-(acetyl-CoA carboxylase) ligase|nr:hypothetical protein [Holosporaceae bacterium]